MRLPNQGKQTVIPPAAKTRLGRDYSLLQREPVPGVLAVAMNPDDMLEWHFVFRGADGTPYEGGVYHAMLKFPPEFPFKPPAIMMNTPSGRFQVNRRLCLSISDYHPESWSPSWTVSAIILGLISFMSENPPQLDVGSMKASDEERRRLASDSIRFNLNDNTFLKLFPDLVQKMRSGEIRYEVQSRAAADAHQAKKSPSSRDAEAVEQVRRGCAVQ